MTPAWPGSGWRRWRPGIVATALLHGAVLLALSVSLHESHPLAAPPSVAVEMISAPPAAQSHPVTPPSQSRSLPVRPPTPMPPIALPHPSSNGIAIPPPSSPAAPAPALATQPAPAPPPAAAAAIAPIPRAATSSFDPKAKSSWEADVLAKLEAAKRYPASARFAHEEATIQVQFEVDRGGRVTWSKLVRPSEMPDLDDEVLALLKRVRLPPPPATMPVDALQLTVPIEFSIDHG